MKKRAIYFGLISTIVLGLVTMIVIDWLKSCMPWSLIVLILIQCIATAWFIKGKAIFYPSFYRSYKIINVHEIQVPEELQNKVMGIPKVEGKPLDIKNHIVVKKIRKKRFEL